MNFARSVACLCVLSLGGCAPTPPEPPVEDVVETEVLSPEELEFRRYFGDRDLDLVEGIWSLDDGDYRIAIMKNESGVEQHYDYVGVIIRDASRVTPIRQSKVFLNSTVAENIFTGVYFDDSGHRQITSFVLENPDLIRIHSVLSEEDPRLVREYALQVN